MEICKLTSAILKKATETKQANGTRLKSYEVIGNYKVWEQAVEDEVNSQIYGANIYKILKLKTPRKDLEAFLKSKNNNSSDNISKYFIFMENNVYKVNDAKTSGITIERINETSGKL